jgi:hypothetical protein
VIRMNEDQIINAMLTEEALSDLVLQYPWVDRAVNSGMRTENNESVRTANETHSEFGQIVFPTIRLIDGELYNYMEDNEDLEGLQEAMNIAVEKGDFIPVSSIEAGEALSFGLSNYLGAMK